MGRHNRKKRQLKKELTPHIKQSPQSQFTPLSYGLFFLGTLGEIVLYPLKMVFVVISFIRRLIERELKNLSLLQTNARNKSKLYWHVTTKPNINPRLPVSQRKESQKLYASKYFTKLRVEIALKRLSINWFIERLTRSFRQPFFRQFPNQKILFQLTPNKHKQDSSLSRSLPKIESKQKLNSKFLFILRSLTLILLGCLFMLGITFSMELSRLLKSLPNPKLLSTRDIPLTTKLFDRNGILLYEFFVDQDRTIIPLTSIPTYLKQATIAIEDREFYRHQGFSVRGMLRAAKETLFKDNIQGGSTITQQLIKSALLTPEITIQRKVKELILALWAEQIYSKNQILEMYLNQVPYGGTAWGVESAAQTFFGKSVESISLAEAALLAGLPAAPSEYSPFGNNREKGIARQHEVLRRMVEEKFITQTEADQALNQPLVFASPRIPIRAPHFVLYARDFLLQHFGERQVLQGGLSVRTTLDANLQDSVQKIVTNEIEQLKPLSVSNGAALVTDPKTGSILAMVGSKDYFNLEADGNVNVTTAQRQPGSSIKVVTYTAALEHGFTAATLIDDSPISYRIPGQAAYSPVNYDGRWHGLVPLRYALGNSYNIPAVKTLDKIGLMTMIEKGREMGIETWEDPSRFGLSLALGGGEVTMIDMAEVYGTLANGGRRQELTPILEVTDFTGKTIYKSNTSLPIQATTPEVAWIMSNILSDNIARTQAFGPNSSLIIPGKTVSVKTGTTNEKRDNWTIGYTPSFVTTVWVGNNNNRPMNPLLTSGITGAAPIWQQIMKELLKNSADEIPEKPGTIVTIPCYLGRPEYFIRGTEPKDGKCLSWPISPTVSPTP
jgi:1A family penicillin-binding protein